MKKVLFLAATALALVGCQPQGSSPDDSGVQSGSGQGSSGALTNQTNQSSSSQPPSQTPNQE